MSRFRLPVISLLCVLGAIALILTIQPDKPAHAASGKVQPKKTLRAFSSDEELKQLFAEYRRKHPQENNRRFKGADMPAPPAEMAAMVAGVATADSKAAMADESITNTQTAGVDEGGIVKAHGKHLVILRRGRLFTVELGQKPGSTVKPVSSIPAYAPDMPPGGTWYDEMLISGDTIVVTGYSYSRGGTEIGLFDIDKSGQLSYRDTYYLRSNDYYSARNFASRLIGQKLIFYTPLVINYYQDDPFIGFPALDRWQGKSVPADFKRIVPANRIYYAGDNPDAAFTTLHTVQICDLSKREMTCTATGVLGPYGSEFYISRDSVYIWTVAGTYSRTQTASTNTSAVYRLPLDGAAPSMLKTMGSPIDQFSFLESGDGYLNVLLRANGSGGRMWMSEQNGNTAMALMRIAVDQFSDGKDTAPDSAYHPLPASSRGALQNRFIGDWLLYGSGSGWGRSSDQTSPLYAVRWGQGDTPLFQVSLPHGIDRIEALGGDAAVVGTQKNDLYFSSISLKTQPRIAGKYVRQNAAQGETRSHGFFYRSDNRDSGILGLPIRGGGQSGWRQLRENSAAVLFLRNNSLRLSELGALVADDKAGQNDGCQSSCVDWYGNARPLFMRGRVFALMGYELVEGRVVENRIDEVQRVDFSPSQKIIRPE